MKNKYISVPELARKLHISRIAVYKKIKKGEIHAIRIGKNYAISMKDVEYYSGSKLRQTDKRKVELAVKRVVSTHGKVLRVLGRKRK